MPTVAEVKKACSELVNDLSFQENRESGEHLLAVTVKQGVWLENNEFDSLRTMFLDRFGIQYDMIRRGWLFKVTDDPESTPPEPKFTTASDLMKTRTGLPKTDEKLEEIETEKLITGEILLVEIGRVQPNKYNPNEMTAEEFKALLENMRREGPQGTDSLLLRPLGPEHFEVIDGEHRLKVAEILKWPKLRCIVREVSEDRAKEINYAKNKLRGHINPFKEANLFYDMWQKLGTQEAVAKKFSISQPYVADTLALRKIPEETQKIIPRGIKRSSLEILARIEDPADQEKLAEKIAEGITVREAQEYANQLRTESLEKPVEKPSKEKPPTKRDAYWCPHCEKWLDPWQVFTDRDPPIHNYPMCYGVVEFREKEKKPPVTEEKEAKVPSVLYQERMRVKDSNAEDELAMALSDLVLKGEINSSGQTEIEIGIKSTVPDRCWPNRKIAFYLDGDEVHELGDLWDDEVDATLRRRGWTIIRERYHAPITKQRLKEIVGILEEVLK